MASLPPSPTSLSSSGSMTPTSSSSSSSIGALPTADIRIIYESDEGTPLDGNVINRPEMIGIGNLRERDNLQGSPASTPCSLSSPSSSDCLSSNTSLNSPGSRSSSPKNLQPCNLAIQGLTMGLDQTHLSISRASSMDEGIFSSPLNSPSRSTPSSPIGPKFKIIHEGDIHLCRLNHQRTVISKILSSKFLRRWETHRLYLTSVNIASKTPVGFMEVPIPYCHIEDVYSVSRWDSSQKFYIRIVISDGSVLLQLPNKWVRDQWLNSINWKRFMLKFQRILVNSSIRPDILLKELKNLIDLTLTTPLQDECINQTSLDIINEVLQLRLKDFERKDYSVEMQINSKKLNEEIIKTLSPFLERTNPSPDICLFLSKHCRAYPRSMVICEHYSEIVQRILKHNSDFGKNLRTRILVQDYFMALNQQNDGQSLVRHFIKCVHGFSSTCPHPRVVNNIVSVCLAAIYSLFSTGKLDSMCPEQEEKEPLSEDEWRLNLQCFVNIFYIISQFDDWRPVLAQILQPIPLPETTLKDTRFTIPFKSVIKNIISDQRCDVHQMILGIREGKESWLQIYSPGYPACDDDGELWSLMLKILIECCCRKKRFYTNLIKEDGPKKPIQSIELRALRGDEACQQILCDILEMDLLENEFEKQQQIIATLQITESGRHNYEDLCQRQFHLQELQKGGPRKLTLPPRSIDADLIKHISCGALGNLENLTLCFTHVTSACATYLIKLPSLRCLNLWSTQFSDSGVQLIAEHLTQLEVLNLCETPVSDKALRSLTSLKSLRSLNLCSTNLSVQTYEMLRANLTALEEFDVRYTDAW